MPQLPDNTIAAVIEGIVELDWQIAASVVVGRTLFVLNRRFINRKDLGPSRGNDVLVFSTGFFVGHKGTWMNGCHRGRRGKRGAGVADNDGGARATVIGCHGLTVYVTVFQGPWQRDNAD